MLLYPSSAFGSGLGTSAQLPVTGHLNPSDLKGLAWPRLAPCAGRAIIVSSHDLRLETLPPDTRVRDVPGHGLHACLRLSRGGLAKAS